MFAVQATCSMVRLRGNLRPSRGTSFYPHPAIRCASHGSASVAFLQIEHIPVSFRARPQVQEQADSLCGCLWKHSSLNNSPQGTALWLLRTPLDIPSTLRGAWHTYLSWPLAWAEYLIGELNSPEFLAFCVVEIILLPLTLCKNTANDTC